MQDATERPMRRAKGRGRTQASPEPQKPAIVARWTCAPELEAYMARAATRPAPLRDMIIFAWRGDA